MDAAPLKRGGLRVACKDPKAFRVLVDAAPLFKKGTNQGGCMVARRPHNDAGSGHFATRPAASTTLARLYCLLIPARPIHLAVFGAAAIAANLFGLLDADAALTAGLVPVIILLVVTIALDIMRLPPYTSSRC